MKGDNAFTSQDSIGGGGGRDVFDTNVNDSLHAMHAIPHHIYNHIYHDIYHRHTPCR